MKQFQDLQVGDKITITSGRHGGYSTIIRTVAKVTKTSITDSDGGRWSMSGSLWGSSFWDSSHANVYKDGDDKRVAKSIAADVRQHKVLVLDRVAWADHTDEVLDAVLAILQEASQ